MTIDRRRLPLLLLAACLPAGCSTLPPNTSAPRISVAGLRIIDIDLLEQRYALRLRVQNPNDFALSVSGMDYAVELNGRDFAKGVSDRRMDVPAYSERLFEVEITSGLADLVHQLQALESGRSKGLRYRIHGHVRLEGIGSRVPFEHAAELLPASPDRAPADGTIRTTGLVTPDDHA